MEATSDDLLGARARIRVTDDDKSPLLGICSILFAVMALAGFLGRVYTKLTVVKKLFADDFAILAALTLAISQSILIVVAANNGLGRRTPAPTELQVHLLDKTAFAAALIYVAVMTLTKVSAALFIRNIVRPITEFERLAYAYCAGVTLWGVASLFGAAFTHGYPKRGWGFWNSFGVMNIFSDLLLIVWPIYMFRSLRMNLKKRSLVSVCFVARVTTVAATVVQMVYLNHMQSQSDYPFAVWPLVVCTQAVQAFSIITTCIPSLFPFFRNVSSGMLRSDNFQRCRIEGTCYGFDLKAGSRKASTTVSSLAAIAGSQSDPSNSLPFLFRDEVEYQRSWYSAQAEIAPNAYTTAKLDAVYIP